MAAVRSNDYEVSTKAISRLHVLVFLKKAVATLNGLQTNADVLAEIRKHSKGRSKFMFSLTGEFLNRTGMRVNELCKSATPSLLF